MYGEPVGSDALYREAMDLPDEERATLAVRLLASVDEPAVDTRRRATPPGSGISNSASTHWRAVTIQVRTGTTSTTTSSRTTTSSESNVQARSRRSGRDPRSCGLVPRARSACGQPIHRVGRSVDSTRCPVAQRRRTEGTRSTVTIRRVPVGRFPYQVVYASVDDVTYILAVAHRHRRPGYWDGRLPN